MACIRTGGTAEAPEQKAFMWQPKDDQKFTTHNSDHTDQLRSSKGIAEDDKLVHLPGKSMAG